MQRSLFIVGSSSYILRPLRRDYGKDLRQDRQARSRLREKESNFNGGTTQEN